jgi:hypothetical protein
MSALIENLINGNLTDAKEQAKRYGFWAIARSAQTYFGSRNKAIMAAAYLKGRVTFQSYCDAV